MDVSEYLPMFLAEAREHLQELNLAIVRVETSPDDRETIDGIFRIAHSFKGMSATMGFEGIASLTHRMEDVLELLRQRRGGLEREAIDVLLGCLDALEGAVDAIADDGSERLDPAALLVRLDDLVREDATAAAAPAGSDPMTPDVLAALASGRRVVRVMARLGRDCAMPAVRAYMVLAALGDHGELLGSAPAEADVDSFAGTAVEAWLATDHEDEVVRAAAAEIADVDGVDIGEAEAPPTEPDEPAAAAAPEAPAAARAGVVGGKASSSVRVDAERLDQLMHLMGELVVHRTTLEALVAGSDIPGLPQAMQDVTRSSQALQAMVMQVRMIPVEAVFLRFPRLVRDLSNRLGKTVELKLVGQETELDRTVVDALGDPIVHLVRNAIDHGLEPPEERLAAGKPETGTVEISARHAGGNVVITVRDDGRGIDARRVAVKAVERGLIAADQVESVDIARAVELLFAPGFSTVDVATDLSGRGVGMDAVRTSIRALGGEVLMSAEPGAGTTAQVRLPLTLAIMPALVVEVGGGMFAVPIDRVERILALRDHAVRPMGGRPMLLLDDGVLALCDGAAALGLPDVPEPCEHAVIVRGAAGRVALGVAGLAGQRELVTRPLPPEVGQSAAVSGGAVLADGGICLIVDCDALALAGEATPSGPRGATV